MRPCPRGAPPTTAEREREYRPNHEPLQRECDHTFTENTLHTTHITPNYIKNYRPPSLTNLHKCATISTRALQHCQPTYRRRPSSGQYNPSVVVGAIAAKAPSFVAVNEIYRNIQISACITILAVVLCTVVVLWGSIALNHQTHNERTRHDHDLHHTSHSNYHQSIVCCAAVLGAPCCCVQLKRKQTQRATERVRERERGHAPSDTQRGRVCSILYTIREYIL